MRCHFLDHVMFFETVLLSDLLLRLLLGLMKQPCDMARNCRWPVGTASNFWDLSVASRKHLQEFGPSVLHTKEMNSANNWLSLEVDSFLVKLPDKNLVQLIP